MCSSFVLLARAIFLSDVGHCHVGTHFLRWLFLLSNNPTWDVPTFSTCPTSDIAMFRRIFAVGWFCRRTLPCSDVGTLPVNGHCHVIRRRITFSRYRRRDFERRAFLRQFDRPADVCGLQTTHYKKTCSCLEQFPCGFQYFGRCASFAANVSAHCLARDIQLPSKFVLRDAKLLEYARQFRCVFIGWLALAGLWWCCLHWRWLRRCVFIGQRHVTRYPKA